MRLTALGKSLIVLLVFAIGAVAGAAGAAATRRPALAWRCVLVRPGDTLWGLAGRSERDPRGVIDRIVARNRLGKDPISPGMALWVPWDDPVRAAPDECGLFP